MIERSILLNGDLYQRTDGAETSAIVSEICMQSLESTAIATADHPPKVWERHVDVVFSIVPSRKFTSLNTVHQRRKNNPTLPMFNLHCSI